MTFYIQPPPGDLPLRSLQKWTQTRLQFLLRVHLCQGNMLKMRDLIDEFAADMDCLMEGSKKDSVSHFILRLVCSQDAEMRDFLQQSELYFFRYRFSCFTDREILSSLRPLKRYHSHLLSLTSLSTEEANVLSFLQHLTQFHSWSSLVRCYRTNQDLVTLPFYYVCDLVAKRAVTVRNGMALVPCCRLGDLLGIVFSHILKEGLFCALKTWNVLHDIRIQKLQMHTRKVFASRSSHKSDASIFPINCEDLTPLQKYLPPCMDSKLSILAESHRLRHHSRIQLTLFLKELGMPLNEALRFWRLEYSQPSKTSDCAHHWESNHKRYTYSVRHMYGLEGARKNYRGHSCRALQVECEEGGCPFKGQGSPTRIDAACHKHFTQKLSKLSPRCAYSVSNDSKSNLDESFVESCKVNVLDSVPPFFEKPIDYFKWMYSICNSDKSIT